jgi:hypothetical protein
MNLSYDADSESSDNDYESEYDYESEEEAINNFIEDIENKFNFYYN